MDRKNQAGWALVLQHKSGSGRCIDWGGWRGVAQQRYSLKPNQTVGTKTGGRREAGEADPAG